MNLNIWNIILSAASFEALMAVMFQVEVCCVVTHCSVVVGYQGFGILTTTAFIVMDI
jgi:hypothetical protein